MANARTNTREKLAGLAARGLTQAQAARDLKVSRQRVSQLAAQMKLSFRPNTVPVPKDKLGKLSKRGLTQTEAARELGVSQKRVSKLAREFGLGFATMLNRPRPPTTDLGKVLQKARVAAGLSYRRLATMSGLHARHVDAIEIGRVKRPTERTLRALAKCLSPRLSYEQLARAAYGPEGAPKRRARRRAPKGGSTKRGK